MSYLSPYKEVNSACLWITDFCHILATKVWAFSVAVNGRWQKMRWYDWNFGDGGKFKNFSEDVKSFPTTLADAKYETQPKSYVI